MWARNLANGDVAVLILNRGGNTTHTRLDFSSFLSGAEGRASYRVRDLQTRKDLGIGCKHMSFVLAAHETAFVRLAKINDTCTAPPLPPCDPPTGPTPAPPRPTPPPTPPTPAPSRICPNSTGVKWKQVTPAGYWKNHGVNHAESAASMELCASKCIATPNCVAFEAFEVGTAGAGCYTFIGTLEQPFTPYEGCSTCVRIN
jgi:hypothetical protein